MAKRKTKAQREQEQYDALYQRVYDVVCGACGRAFDDDGESDFLCPEDLSRVIPALQALFERKGHRGDEVVTLNEYLFMPHNLNHYDTVSSIASFLWEHEVRA